MLEMFTALGVLPVDYSLGFDAVQIWTGFNDVVQDNIGAILAILGTFYGLNWVRKRFNSGTRGKL